MRAFLPWAGEAEHVDVEGKSTRMEANSRDGFELGMRGGFRAIVKFDQYVRKAQFFLIAGAGLRCVWIKESAHRYILGGDGMSKPRHEVASLRSAV